MFTRIATTLRPKTGSDKYAGTYEGKPPKTGLATIEDGQEMQRFILSNMQQYRKAPTFIKACNLIAKLTESGKETYIGIEKMLEDRFPADKPIELFVEIEQGANATTADDIGGEEINPAQTNGHIMFNVYDLAVSILNHGKPAIIAVFEQIDRAADVAIRGGIAAVVAQEVAANDADNKAREAQKQAGEDGK